MAIKTTAEKLESVQTAIAAIESGAQGVTVNGSSVTYADLSTLYAREQALLTQYRTEQGIGGGPVFSRGYKAR